MGVAVGAMLVMVSLAFMIFPRGSAAVPLGVVGLGILASDVLGAVIALPARRARPLAYGLLITGLVGGLVVLLVLLLGLLSSQAGLF